MGFESRAALLLILPPAGLPASTRASLPFHSPPSGQSEHTKGSLRCLRPSPAETLPASYHGHDIILTADQGHLVTGCCCHPGPCWPYPPSPSVPSVRLAPASEPSLRSFCVTCLPLAPVRVVPAASSAPSSDLTPCRGLLDVSGWSVTSPVLLEH